MPTHKNGDTVRAEMVEEFLAKYRAEQRAKVAKS